MIRERFHHRSRHQPQTQINLTPLLDTMFNLLIAFIIIAPALKHGLKIELPEVKAAKLDEQEKPLVITIKKLERDEEMERIYFQGERIDLERLSERVSAALDKNGRKGVIIEADKGVRYGTFARVVGELQEIGVHDIGLVTEPRAKKSREKSREE